MPACESALTRSAAGVSYMELGTIVELAARRLALAVDVAAAKFAGGQPVDDPAREQQILDWVAEEPGEAGRDARVAFFRDQMAASKIIQRGLLAYWRAHPEDVPGRSHNLARDIRPALDSINNRMLPLVPRLKETTPKQLLLAEAALDTKLAATPALQGLGETRREAARVALRSLPAA